MAERRDNGGRGAAPWKDFFLDPEQRPRRRGGEEEHPRLQPDSRDAIALRRPPGDGEPGTDRADDERDDSGGAGLPNADAQEKPVERQAEGNREAHVDSPEGPTEAGGVHESEYDSQRGPYQRSNNPGCEPNPREAPERSLARLEARAVSPHNQEPDDQHGRSRPHKQRATQRNPERVEA